MNLHVNGTRLWKRIEQLAEIGATGDGGVLRLALSPEDKLGRDLVVSWMEELGLAVKIDQLGNLIGLRAGEVDEQPVLVGSHLDTVQTGGRFNGAYGVLAGLEVVQVLNEAGQPTHRPLGVVAFTNEEGVRYQTDMLGSQAFCGLLPVEAARAVRGVDGTVVGAELERIGYSGDFPCAALHPHAYLELHIEQGPILERERLLVGVVEAITGIAWQEVTIRGAANHAGTTPMDARHDAGLAAARIVAALPELAAGLSGQKATCGRFALDPGAINVVPRAAVFTVDLRNSDEGGLLLAERRLAELAEVTAAAAGCSASLERLGYAQPALCAPEVLAQIEAAAAALGYPFRRMTSGAGHDAQFLARICPTGMIFIPSRGGISHSPLEHSSPDAIQAGANVLLEVVLRLSD